MEEKSYYQTDEYKALRELAKEREAIRELLRSQRRGWSHLIDHVKYSSGPGDNIYVYG